MVVMFSAGVLTVFLVLCCQPKTKDGKRVGREMEGGRRGEGWREGVMSR